MRSDWLMGESRKQEVKKPLKGHVVGNRCDVPLPSNTEDRRCRTWAL